MLHFPLNAFSSCSHTNKETCRLCVFVNTHLNRNICENVTAVLLHLQQEFKSVIVFDSALTASHSSQVGEPNTRDPVFVIWRVEAFKLLSLFSRNESCTEQNCTYAGFPSKTGKNFWCTGYKRVSLHGQLRINPHHSHHHLQPFFSPASTTWSTVGKRLKTAVLTERRMSRADRLA